MKDEAELLWGYANTGAEEVFRRIVESHLGIVYSAALRKLNGDRTAAQDVAQMVFSDLARKAKFLPANVVLAGWLYRHTCLKAAELELAFIHKLLEPPNRDLIESARNFGETGRSIRLEVRAPSDQSVLGKDQVRPWKDRKQVTA